MRYPPSSSLFSFSPVAGVTRGGPAAKTWEVPLTMMEKWAATTLKAPSPATEPRATATTGTRPRRPEGCQVG